MFTKGDVAIFAAATMALVEQWDSDIKIIRDVKSNMLDGARKQNIMDALMKLTAVMMMDSIGSNTSEEEEEEEAPRKESSSGVAKKIQDPDGFKIVFNQED